MPLGGKKKSVTYGCVIYISGLVGISREKYIISIQNIFAMRIICMAGLYFKIENEFIILYI